MRYRMSRLIVPALLAAAIPTLALAQQAQPPAQAPGAPPAKGERMRPALSPEARARLLDGRVAMIKETLKLNDAQLKLWGPVEAQMRAQAAARESMRAERRERRDQAAARPSLPDRLDRASEATAKRAQDMKAFADAFRPFYASLSDEQKALSGIVLHQARGHHGPRGHRWAMQRGPGGPGPRQ